MIRVSATNETEVYKKSSVILSGSFAAITAFGPALLDAWNAAPPALRDALPDGVARWVATVAFLLIIVARHSSIKTDA
jgi:hypothetical protein